MDPTRVFQFFRTQPFQRKLLFWFLVTVNAWGLTGTESYWSTSFPSVTYSKRSFVGQVGGKKFSSDWFGCVDSCASDVSCSSYNFHQGLGTCELNYVGLKSENCEEESVLVYSERSVFHRLRVTTAFWSQWEQWSPCNRSCGMGTQERIRQCVSLHTAKSCSGSEVEQKACYLSACPESGFCAGKPDGNYQDVTNCERFIRCVAGGTSYTYCQAGLVYNSATDSCVFSDSDHDCPIK